VHKNKGVVECYAHSILFLIRESTGCCFHFPVHTVTTPLEILQIPVHRVRALEKCRERRLQWYVKNFVYRNQYS